jgi:DNA primase
MQDNWVDFKAVKAAVSMQAVLDRYQINWLRKNGDELRGRCPIHQGEGQNTFHVHLTKNAFNCFSCKARGNVLDLVAAMEKCSVRDAGLKLQEWYSVAQPAAADSAKTEPAERGTWESETNKALSFQLKGIDHGHSYLAERGVSKETAESFGVGYFAGKGSMRGRIVIPIHNERGELVAYAGRAIDGSEPRYKLPAGFHKSLELFNLHRAIGESNSERRVVVVEGFFDCLKVVEAGFPCVALMGSSLSEAQEELLVKHFGRAWLMLDGDEAGRNAAAECVTRIGLRMWVRLAQVPVGKQPDQLSADELKVLLEK